ncbi:pyridoxamine 5'-phosphate oxidase family protein [uncultured Cohaesibacter sp.]|uniref:pyridoxamine 5'-phosphate oxidase family protein n=1 Tax=uncultured Cohaesibacter sp. TaxID=1002546 RepID=UPI0029C7B36D|nr:pyridoxamine 5'-phosphate oxidase family protein [uncultured Cohaesibacter sp.]
MQAIFTKDIDAFLRDHHVMSLATVSDGSPWAASVFYAFDEDRGRLIYLSSKETRHGKAALLNAEVAATIARQELEIEKIRGLQISGFTVSLEGEDAVAARTSFSKRFPDIDLQDAAIWSLVPDYIKMVDNSLGFGEKIIWPYPEAKG